MHGEDRLIAPGSLSDDRTNSVRNLHGRMEALRAEFMRVQEDGAIAVPECLARLDVLRAEIRHTFAQIQSHNHGNLP